MSKTKKNVTSPLEHLAEVGVDASRLYTLFIGPPEIDAEWNDDAVMGPFKFLRRLWVSAHRNREQALAYRKGGAPASAKATAGKAGDRELRRKTHQTIAAVTEDLERFGFNTAIAKLMELGNAIEEKEGDPATGEALAAMALLMAPLAPHISEELHALFGGTGSVFRAGWPAADPAVAAEDEVEIVVQVNGKVRGRARVRPGASNEEMLAAARPEVAGLAVVKEIVVPGRLVNFVVKNK
jgi:leucyl-tRNA synthetase